MKVDKSTWNMRIIIDVPLLTDIEFRLENMSFDDWNTVSADVYLSINNQENMKNEFTFININEDGR